MSKVLVFNRAFFALSETFIYRQILPLTKKFDVVLMGFRFQYADKFKLTETQRIQLKYYQNSLDRILTLIRRLMVGRIPFSFFTDAKVRRILREQEIDVIHAHYGWNGITILPYAKKFKIPLVVSFHGINASASLRKQTYREGLGPMFEYASAIILCSPHMQANLSLGKYKDKVKVIPYGIDPDDFSPYPKSDSQVVKILHSGRIAAKKGVPDLIRVFSKLYRQHKSIELHILGKGEELDVCKLLVHELNIDNCVTFYDAQPQDRVKQLMNEADIFVLNSRTDDTGDMEGLPNALLEAMSFEKAVVSTVHAGIPLAVQHNYNGLLVPEKDNDALFNALNVFIVNEELRVTVGKNARQTIIKDFHINGMELSLLKIFDEIKATS